MIGEVPACRITSVGLLLGVNRQLRYFSREYLLIPIIGSRVVENWFIPINHFLWVKIISG
jgi:hypothetical protein